MATLIKMVHSQAHSHTGPSQEIANQQYQRREEEPNSQALEGKIDDYDRRGVPPTPHMELLLMRCLISGCLHTISRGARMQLASNSWGKWQICLS